MRDDKIRNALMKMEPDAMLSAKIDAMVDAADLTPREPAVRRVKRPAKAMLIAAAIVVMMAMAVSAVGVFARLFYLPGAGLVDESGVLVIKEDDIGDLDVTAYRTASELELGGYVIESVTYTEYEGTKSYTIWSRMGDEMIAEFEKAQQAHIGVTVADHVISDLALTLSDGTILTPESTRYSHSGSIVYHFAADVLDTNVIISSERIGEAIPVQLYLVEGAGYSYMEYPTDQGITLILCPMNADYTDWKLDYIDNSIADGLAEYIYDAGIYYEPDSIRFYDEQGNLIDMRSKSWERRSTEKGSQLSFDAEVPEGGFRVERAEMDSVTVRYALFPTEKYPLVKEFPMPADGERVNRKIMYFDDAGFNVTLEGYSRDGETISIYARADFEFGMKYLENSVRMQDFPVPYSGTNGCRLAYAMIGMADVGDHMLRSVSGGTWVDCGDGLWRYDMEIGLKDGKLGLDDCDSFSLMLEHLVCLFDGSWTVTY